MAEIARKLAAFEYALQCTLHLTSKTILWMPRDIENHTLVIWCGPVFTYFGIGSHGYSHSHPKVKVFINKRFIHHSM